MSQESPPNPAEVQSSATHIPPALCQVDVCDGIRANVVASALVDEPLFHWLRDHELLYWYVSPKRGLNTPGLLRRTFRIDSNFAPRVTFQLYLHRVVALVRSRRLPQSQDYKRDIVETIDLLKSQPQFTLRNPTLPWDYRDTNVARRGPQNKAMSLLLRDGLPLPAPPLVTTLDPDAPPPLTDQEVAEALASRQAAEQADIHKLLDLAGESDGGE